MAAVKHKPLRSPARMDPSGTSGLRNRFAADMARRSRNLRSAIWRKVYTEDCFGLRPTPKLILHAEREFQFETDTGKIRQFHNWLGNQVATGLLQKDADKPWTNPYIYSAYRAGVIDAYINTHRLDIGKPGGFMQGGQAEFLRQSFNSPVTINSLELLYTRTFSGLKGITDQMDADISRILTGALAHGKGAYATASALTGAVVDLTRKRALVLARTEIIHSNAEAALDSYEALGVDELNLEVEWSTAGDGRVCPRCAARAGKIYTVKESRGLIPLHPNCVLGDQTVQSPDAVAMTRAQYTGKIIEVKTACGSEFSVTPNHILLTEFGCVPARLLYNGLNLVYAGSDNWAHRPSPYDDCGIPSISDIFASLGKSDFMVSHCVPTSPEYFHGDGKALQEEIHIIHPNSKLGSSMNTPTYHEVIEDFLPTFEVGCGDTELDTLCSMKQLLFSAMTTAGSLIGGGRDCLAFFIGGLLKAQNIRGGTSSSNDTIVRESFADNAALRLVLGCQGFYAHTFIVHFDDFINWDNYTVDFGMICDRKPQLVETLLNSVRFTTNAAGNGIDGFPAGVTFDKIVDVQVKFLHDVSVFDLSTKSTFYLLNGLVTSNCRCSWSPYIAGITTNRRRKRRRQLQAV